MANREVTSPNRCSLLAIRFSRIVGVVAAGIAVVVKVRVVADVVVAGRCVTVEGSRRAMVGIAVVARVVSPAAAADIAESRVAGELAAASAAQWRVLSAARDLVEGASERTVLALASAEHVADAAEQEPAADHAGRRRCRGAEERAAARRSLRHGPARLAAAPLLLPAAPLLLWLRAGTAPGRAAGAAAILRRNPHGLLARTHRRNRAAPLVAAEQRPAHAVEEALVLSGALGPALRPALRRIFELADIRVGLLERFVLDEDALHQRVDGVRRLREPLADGLLGLRVARLVFESGEPLEQISDELALLRCHGGSSSADAEGA